MSSDTLSHHHIPTESRFVEADGVRTALIDTGQPRPAIPRLDDTIAYRRLLRAAPDAVGAKEAPP